MSPADPPLATVEGLFWRAIRADRAEAVLAPPGPDGAGRYHRPGEPALYLTLKVDWARTAIAGYWRKDGAPRVAVPLNLTPARVFDPRDPVACAALSVDPDWTRQSWLTALAERREPPSWRISDAARASGADGMIDISRGIPGGWHVVLFRWNVPGAPSVTPAGAPEPLAPPNPEGPVWG